MFDKLRRRSRASMGSVATATSQSSPSACARSSTSKAVTFFDLPSELRIEIYELVAYDMRLSLFSTPPKHIKMPALLLATHQTRAEYRPILLSLAPLRAHITNYDFRPLMRVVGSLYSTELKALRTNPNLTIVLHLKNLNATDSDSIARLRRWAVKRAEHLDRLPWSYALANSEPSKLPMALASVHLRHIEKSMARVRTLQNAVHENLAAEIEPIVCLLHARRLHWQAAIHRARMIGTGEYVTFR